jgi:hypothetical protein
MFCNLWSIRYNRSPHYTSTALDITWTDKRNISESVSLKLKATVVIEPQDHGCGQGIAVVMGSSYTAPLMRLRGSSWQEKRVFRLSGRPISGRPCISYLSAEGAIIHMHTYITHVWKSSSGQRNVYKFYSASIHPHRTTLFHHTLPCKILVPVPQCPRCHIPAI